jgi:RNAse (barnase) inhibitor barstar
VRRLSGAVSLAALATTARSMGRSVRIVDGGADKKAALAAFAEGLALPDWFGKNLDALTDALRDLADDTAREIELVWDGTALIARNDPKAYAALLTVLRDVEAERDDLHITVIER